MAELSMRIAIAASGRLGATVAHPLSKSRHTIVALVQDGRQTRGFKRLFTRVWARFFGGSDNMLKFAARNRLPVVYIDKMTEAELAPLRKLDVDILLVSGFAIILKKPLLDLPRIGCVNMHSSLLPRHRGPNPFAAAVAQGDTQSGVTFHVMEEGIDTGDILDQTAFDIAPRDEMFTVYRKACALAGERICEVMDNIERDGLKGRPQDPALATYDPKPTPDTSWIDWRRPAEEIDRMVRGFSPAAMPRFDYRNDVIMVAKCLPNAEPVTAEPGTILQDRPVKIATGEGSLTINVAFCRKPFPWVWPSPFSRPTVGDRLASE